MLLFFFIKTNILYYFFVKQNNKNKIRYKCIKKNKKKSGNFLTVKPTMNGTNLPAKMNGKAAALL